MKKNIPNIITAARIVGAAVLLFIEPLSVPFYMIYSLCGLSDALDGFIARAMKTQSTLGAKLDSIADLTFYAVMFLKVFPTMFEVLDLYVWCVGFAALFIRIISYIFVASKYHKFASLHTVYNKISGLMVFLIPYSLRLTFGMYYCLTAAIMSNIAAIHEFALHLRNRTYGAEKMTHAN